jgi:hypothetical protein
MILSYQSIFTPLIARGVSSQRSLLNFSSLITTHHPLPTFFHCRAVVAPLHCRGKRPLSLFHPRCYGAFSFSTMGGTPTPSISSRSCIEKERHFSLTPLLATHPKNASVTPFLATLPKTQVLKVLCLPHIQKMAGVGVLMLSKFPTREFVPRESAGADGSKNQPQKWYAPAVVGQRAEIPDSLPQAGIRQYSEGPHPATNPIWKRRRCS